MTDKQGSSTSASVYSQVLFLLCLMLRLKSWKFILFLLLLPVLLLNQFLLRGMEKINPDYKGKANVKSISSAKVGSYKILVSSTRPSFKNDMRAIFQSRGIVSNDVVTECQSVQDCRLKFIDSILANSDATRAYAKFDNHHKLECLNAERSDMICPYLFHLMTQSGGKAKHRLKEVHFLRLFDRYKSEVSKKHNAKYEVPHAQDSVCKRTAESEGSFYSHFPLKLMYHIMIVGASMILYFTVSTLASLSNLKENRFLQLMFNNGLSVGAYWFVVWFITIMEGVVLAALVVISYSIQCPGFFSSTGLLKSFIALLFFFIAVASIGLMFTTLIESYFVTLLLMVFICVMTAIFTLQCRMAVAVAARSKDVGSSGAMALLIFPPGHLAEYMLETMIPEKYPLRRPKDFKQYYLAVEILVPMLAAAVMVLTIYVDFLVKSGNGLCLPPLFPFNPNFWNPHRRQLIEMLPDKRQKKKDRRKRQINIESTSGEPAVTATDIVMSYSGLLCSKMPPVLKGVTCTIYQGQITALIGHNGAGKTTLIRVLMGEEIPTSGLVVINGHMMTNPYHRLALRRSISICKQVDILSSHLTVMETMKLALLAKGYSIESQMDKVLDMMRRLGLEGKENVQAMDLSGGQMRKVCSIICLLGNPKLVILDEPTSGLDPVSRRNLWQILKENRVGRSILLCTQFMDEADILADRKIFLSAGKLICAGSSMFLKHAFGCCLTIDVSLRSAKYAKVLARKLNGAKIVKRVRKELQLQVPSKKPKILTRVVKKLEQHPKLVKTFGVSQAQLDDIFMRLKFIDMKNIEASFRSKKLKKLGRGKKSNATLPPVNYKKLYKVKNISMIQASVMQQFWALVAMNFSRQTKAKTKFCFRLLFPVVLVMFIAYMTSTEREEAKKTGNKYYGPAAIKGLVRVSSSDFGLSSGTGVCIFDEDEDNDSEKTKKVCSKMFKLKGGEVDQVSALAKPREVPLDRFLIKQKFLDTMHKLCRFSYCFFLYTTSWNRTQPNNNRVLHIGQYWNAPEANIPNEAAIATGHILTRYLEIATYFDAIPFTGSTNMTVSSAFIMNNMDEFYFYDSYHLILFIIAFSIVPVTYLSDPVEDKECGVRQHLASMGMSSLAYWMTVFIMDWLQYALYFIISAFCLYFIWERYQSGFFLKNICLPMLFVGSISCQLSVYTVSALMRRTSAVVQVCYFFYGMFLSILVNYLQDKQLALQGLACLMPPFAPAILMMISTKLKVYSLLFFETSNAMEVPNLSSAQLSNRTVMVTLVAMPVHILLLIVAIIIIENRGGLQCVKPSPSGPSDGSQATKDTGVKREAQRIKKSPRNNKNLMEVRDLQKVYPNGVRAVRGTTFGAIAGEILGLLGPNGAGKTTTMSIIVGEEAASSGVSEVNFSNTWMSGIDGAHCGAIGYCPQHNPLFNNISVLDHLSFYAQIRGLPSDLAAKQVSGLIDGLGLKPHQAKAAEQLSGGNKRRLCLAIALLGNPSLVVIDEASTGVDPENKRFIWRAIRGMASKFRSVLITTHSMEEVEALCSRVGIMNKGVMIGFGTVQQLRSRHGEAYTLDVLMKARKPQKLRLKKKKLAREIAKKFTGSTVMEDLMSCMQFNLPRKHIPSFSGALRWLIAKKKILGIKYFSLYQMSLDQVFVNLVKENDES